jgi:hypothetical protein
MDTNDPCHGHSHDHDHEDAKGVSLRKYYDLDGIICLNEDVNGSGRMVLAKYYEDRFDDTLPTVCSARGGDDAELLLTIPFTEAVTIRYLSIRGRNPRRIKLFANRGGNGDLDFDAARDMPGDMAIELVPNDHHVQVDDGNNNNNGGTIDYPLRPAGRFQNIDVLTIFFVDNYDMMNNNDDDEITPTEISYVGLKGVGSGIKRQVVEAVYETQGLLKDHKVKDDGGMGSSNYLM